MRKKERERETFSDFWWSNWVVHFHNWMFVHQLEDSNLLTDAKCVTCISANMIFMNCLNYLIHERAKWTTFFSTLWFHFFEETPHCAKQQMGFNFQWFFLLFNNQKKNGKIQNLFVHRFHFIWVPFELFMNDKNHLNENYSAEKCNRSLIVKLRMSNSIFYKILHRIPLIWRLIVAIVSN